MTPDDVRLGCSMLNAGFGLGAGFVLCLGVGGWVLLGQAPICQPTEVLYPELPAEGVMCPSEKELKTDPALEGIWVRCLCPSEEAP